jgi:FixJ family two-component response regulator
MPEMSGRQLTERFAAMRPTAKILYMSGYTDDAVVRHGVVSAGIDYLQKPFSSEALLRKVREVLDAPDRTEAA